MKLKKGTVIRVIKTVIIAILLGLLGVSLGLNFRTTANLEKTTLIASSYKELYTTLDSEFVTEYNYWLEKYKVLRYDYRNLLTYLGETNAAYEIYTCTGYFTEETTSLGFDVNSDYAEFVGVCRVDPEVIPYGSIVFIQADWNRNGFNTERYFLAIDSDALIKGRHIAILFRTQEKVNTFDIRGLPVRIVRKELFEKIPIND